MPSALAKCLSKTLFEQRNAQIAALVLVDANAGIDQRIRVFHQHWVVQQVEIALALVADISLHEAVKRHLDRIGTAKIELPRGALLSRSPDRSCIPVVDPATGKQLNATVCPV